MPRNGEGPQIEFKPYITPGDEKANEIVRTVVAFANSGGGLLLIGVNDRCIVEGIEKGLQPRSAADLSAKRDDYVRWVRKKIANNVNRPPVLRVAPVEIDGHVVVGVRVTEGSETPYCVRVSNDVLVRRGANSVRADVDHNLPRLVR